MSPDDDKDVLELRLDVGDEWESSGLLKDDGDDVVANVPLARQLLPVVRGVRQQRGHVEHDLATRVLRVHRVQTGRIV